jgi:hypothetical protein
MIRLRFSWFPCLPLGMSAMIATAQAADIPIGGTYGTVAMCIIDAFTDTPSSEINYSVGGAPLARATPGEFDLPTQSCVFQRLVSAETGGAKPHWAVEAQCSAGDGNVSKLLDITLDRQARSVQVSEKDGKLVAELDQCSLPYAERLARELKRLPGKPASVR